MDKKGAAVEMILHQLNMKKEKELSQEQEKLLQAALNPDSHHHFLQQIENLFKNN